MTSRIPVFTPRPFLQITRLSQSQQKRLERRLHFAFPLSQRHPPSMSNPRCARIRIWWKDIRTRRRQVAQIKLLKLEIQARISEMDANITLFHHTAALHRLLVTKLPRTPKHPLSPSSTSSSQSSTSKYNTASRRKKKHL